MRVCYNGKWFVTEKNI
ncbi:MAG TPA: hypothetical protein ACHBX0_01190 [Arsenophonus sp.]